MTTEETGGPTTSPTPPSPDAGTPLENAGASTVPQTPASAAFWTRVKEHKVVQWTVAYGAAAYTLLHAVEMVGNSFDWPHLVGRIVTVLLFLGVPIAATLAWYHGHRAQHRVSGPELAILTVLLVIAGSVLWFIGRPSREHASPKAAAETQGSAGPALPTARTLSEKSIAVLPFADMSEKKDQEYFAAGMAEEVTNLLAKLPGLRVIGRTSSFQFNGKSEDLRSIGAKLGAAYLVEGSVRRSGNQVRVTAQLIDAHDGLHRWSDSYDRNVSDVLKVQDDIAVSLARALQITVRNEIGSRSSIKNPEAYNVYLRTSCTRPRLEGGL